MGRSVVSAVLVTMIVTRTVMRLWAISGGGGGGQEAGAIETANSMWTEASRSMRLFPPEGGTASACAVRRKWVGAGVGT